MKSIVVIFGLFAIAVFSFLIFQHDFNEKRNSKAGMTYRFINFQLVLVINDFHDQTGNYPTTAEGFTPLLGDRYPEIGKKVPRDPWGHEFQYRFPAQRSKAAYDVWSLGPDGVPGADDIGNWSPTDAEHLLWFKK